MKSGKVGPVNRSTVPVLVVVSLTNCSKSVLNRCVIELFHEVLCCCFAFHEISVGIGTFVIGLN